MKALYLFLSGLLLLAGCSPEQKPKTAGSIAPSPTTAIVDQSSPTEVPAAADAIMATLPPTPFITPFPTAQPTPTPTSTPRPLVVLAVPPEWADVAQGITNQLNQNSTSWEWHVITGENPADMVAERQANIALHMGTEGQVIYQEPMALTIPLTTEWEGVTLAQAQEIVANGHPLVEFMKWSEMEPTRKALRIDGRLPNQAGFPLPVSWVLKPTPGYETAAAEFIPRFQEVVSANPLIHVVAVGDIMLDRSLGFAIEGGNLEYPFTGVAEQLRTADITIGNLESSLGDKGEPALKHYTFQSPPQAAASLALAGFDVMTLANNHAMDFGPEALLQGISLLDEQGIGTVGAGGDNVNAHSPYIRQVNGLSLAFLGYVHVPVEVGGFDTESWTAAANTPGLAWANPEEIKADVTAVLPQVDMVIVLLHSGFEYIEEPSEPQVAAAHAAVDAGAKLVIGHHAHILQGVEFYKDGVIVYGLGNFAFQIEGDPQTAIFNIWLDKEGVRQLEIVPAIIQFGGQPRLADSWEAASIRRQVYYLTSLLNANR